MRNLIRFSLSALVLAASAACSNGSEQPAVSQDLEQDLAKVGGANVQLAGSSAGRVDVVSAAERTEAPTPTPKAKATTRAPSAFHGTRAAAPSPRRVAPATAAPAPRAPETAPSEVIRQPEPEPTPVPQARPQAPAPSHQPEPRGGWRTPGEVIRNAPFPINP